MTVTYDDAAPFSSPPAGHDQPGLTRLRDYLIATYGGISLGIYVNRAIRGSSAPSIHRDGRALDWRQDDLTQRQAAADWLMLHADALNVQQIIFYEKAIYWRTGHGWRPFHGDYSGASWAKWLHIERNWAGANDLRDPAVIVAGSHPTPDPTPLPTPAPPPRPEPKDPIVMLVEDANGHWLCLPGCPPKSLTAIQVHEMQVELDTKGFVAHIVVLPAGVTVT